MQIALTKSSKLPSNISKAHQITTGLFEKLKHENIALCAKVLLMNAPFGFITAQTLDQHGSSDQIHGKRAQYILK